MKGKLGVPNTYANLESMLGNEDLERLHVLIPPQTQKYLREAIDVNIRATFNFSSYIYHWSNKHRTVSEIYISPNIQELRDNSHKQVSTQKF